MAATWLGARDFSGKAIVVDSCELPIPIVLRATPSRADVRDIVFLDAGVSDVGTLLAGLAPGACVFLLNRAADGVRQIADILASRGLSDLAAIHIVAHGAPGELRLGAARLNAASLVDHAASLAEIGAALAPDGNVMLYGCRLGHGAAGRTFIDALSRATGATVAAASHVVGGASAQSWQLDIATGPVAAEIPFAAQALAGYRATLMADGQLWYTIMDVPGPNAGAPAGTPARKVGGYVNSDGSSFTPTGGTLTGTTTPPTTAWGIAVDTAAGLMFVVDSDDVSVSVYRISDNALLQTLQVGDKAGPGTGDDDLVNAIAVDPINHVLFVNRWDTDFLHTGIVKISYDPLTGTLNANGAYNSGSQQFLITDTSTGGHSTNLTTLDIDIATHKLYYTDWTNNYNFSPFSPQNAIYVVNDYTSATPTVTQLTTSIQFPANGTGGYLGNIAVDDAKGLIYFTASDLSDPPGQAHLYYMPIGGGTATKILDIDNVNLGNSIAAGLSLDPVSQQLYVSLARYSSGTSTAPTANANHVLVYQLSADGHSLASLVANYTLTQLEGQAPTDNNSHPGASVWNQLPVLSVTGTGTHAGEQSSAITLATSFTSSDADGGYYSGASVQITGGKFNSNENSTADDHLFVQDGGTQRISGIFSGTNIAIAYDTANEKLTLSGYDTIAHYNTVMSALRYNTTGDNPTNYGANTTRTLTWIVSDGSANVPSGSQNSGTTTITIDAVNDAPVIATLPAQTFNEDIASLFTNVPLQLVTDVDANPATQNVIVALTVTHGTLLIRTDVSGGIGAGQVVGNGTATITLTAPQNLINTTLHDTNGLTYLSTSNYNGPDTVTVTVNDQANTGSGGAQQVSSQFAITVNAVNDAPSGADNTKTILEDNSYTFAAADFGFTDPIDAANGTHGADAFFGVKLTTLPTAGTLTLSGGAVSVGQVVTVADIPNLVFAPVANANGTNYSHFTFQVEDNGGTANGGVDLDQSANTFTFSVTPVNDAPAGTNKTVSPNEDSAYTFTTADFGFSDVNDSPANNFLAVKITTLPGAGSLTDNGVAVTTGQFVSVTDITGNKLVFTPAANANGTP